MQLISISKGLKLSINLDEMLAGRCWVLTRWCSAEGEDGVPRLCPALWAPPSVLWDHWLQAARCWGNQYEAGREQLRGVTPGGLSHFYKTVPSAPRSFGIARENKVGQRLGSPVWPCRREMPNFHAEQDLPFQHILRVLPCFQSNTKIQRSLCFYAPHYPFFGDLMPDHLSSLSFPSAGLQG